MKILNRLLRLVRKPKPAPVDWGAKLNATAFDELERAVSGPTPAEVAAKLGKRIVYRSSKTGLFVSAAFAAANPSTTYRTLV